MPRAFRIILTIVCALYLSGAHWLVLQMTAWTGMLAARAPQVGLMEAVETTFDGAHPCGLCSAISVGQMEEKEKQPEAPALKKLLEVKLVRLERGVLPLPEAIGEHRWQSFVTTVVERVDAPPVPPPRA